MVYMNFRVNDIENAHFQEWWSQQSFIKFWRPWLVKSWTFKVIYMKYYVYHLKDLKKLYKRLLNGKYRFLLRNSKIRCSKCVFMQSVWFKYVFDHNFNTFIDEFCYFWSEIDMFRLNVFYVTFWGVSNGIHEFSYKWYWKCTFSGVMDVRAIIHKVLTMACVKLDFQRHLYEILCIPFEGSQKVI